MKRLPTRIPDLILIEPDVHRDERGFFLETFRADRYAELGITTELVQDNHSRSALGVLRGLHFQVGEGQPKLVRAVRGRAFDVVVDVRPTSPTFGEYEAFTLDDEEHLQVWIPPGFAHGFCALSEWTDVAYRVGAYYDHRKERGLAWDDPEVGIAWPVAEPLLSMRDAANPRLRDLVAELTGIE